MGTQVFRHRVNKIAEIANLEPGWGAELDLRSDIRHPGKILVTHDAWGPAEDFEDWLKEYAKRDRPGGLILNTKEDGLESRVMEILKSKSFEDYFFLDTTVPTLVKWTEVEKKGNFAVRMSQFEGPSFVAPFLGKAKWLWVDCFFGQMVPEAWLKELKGKIQICLVSPELQGMPVDLIVQHQKVLGPYANAVCTKRPDLWTNFI